MLPELDKLLRKNYKNVVVMLSDGMGTSILKKHLPADAFLIRYFQTTISLVFPATTTAATVTMESGLSPIEHGWLGWRLYFDEVGANVDIFPNTLPETDGVPAADYHVAWRYLPYKSVQEKICEAGRAEAYRISAFSSWHSQSVEEICDSVASLCGRDGKKYIYTYWHQPDYDIHGFGTQHEQITADIRQINELVEKMCAALSDTLVIVTADHGLVDIEWRYLSEYPQIMTCLERAPAVENRALSFFVKPDRKRQFETEFKRHFGDCYRLFTKDEVLSLKLFGQGMPHPRSLDFIGDYLSAAIGNTAIDLTPPINGEASKAAHAGLTEDEMEVPFIAIERSR